MKSKIIIFSLAAAVLTLGLLGSCSKINERVDNLENRVDILEESVNSINNSIADLGVIRQQVQNLMSSVVGPGALSKLKEADNALGKRIEDLEEMLEGGTVPTAAIEQLEDAVEDLKALETKVDGINTNLTKAIKDAKDGINATIKELKDNLAAMIQTVTIVPAYQDGSVESLDDTVTIEFMVAPASAVAAIAKENVSVMVNEVKTKAVNDTTAPVIGFSKNATKGTVSIKADLKELVPTEAKKSLTVAVKIACGISEFVTEFVPVKLTNTINDVLPGVFSVSATTKVHFLRGNLWYKSSDNSWHIEDKQYYKENDGIGARQVVEDQTLWNFYDREHLMGFYYPSSVQNSNYGTKDLTKIQHGIEKAELYSNYGVASGDYPFVDKINWGEAYGKGHSLTYAEWGYLCSVSASQNDFSDTDYSNDVRAGRNKNNVSVAGCKGLLLVPDDWDLAGNPLVDSYTEEQWAEAEAAGAVFLPYVYGMGDAGAIVMNVPLGVFVCSDTYDNDLVFYAFDDGKVKMTDIGSGTDGILCTVRLTVYVGE